MQTVPKFQSVLIALMVSVAWSHGARAQTGTVGIYTDASGTTCSFAGNDPGLVTAYVVVRPGPEGVRGVRFSAPVPQCFRGVFVDELHPAGLPFIGESQTGISITSGQCEMLPLHVLTITYMRNGATTACCPYEVLPESGFQAVQAVNCAGEEFWFG